MLAKFVALMIQADSSEEGSIGCLFNWDWVISNRLSEKSPVLVPILYLRTHFGSDQNDILIYELEEN
jgi:hypothetical protein